ncbi:MAG: hypothetical protein JO208_13295 [Alphaproteobacteria bacterium]|nr:hypothetical protein [Alphaproteobacteria bacterium]
MKRQLTIIAIVFWATASTAALGQTLEDRLRDQLRQTTEQLHQLQDGQTALQARASAAEAERDTLKKEVVGLKAQLAHARPSSSGPPPQVLVDQVARDKAALAQAAATVQEAQADHVRLQAIVTKQVTMLQVCQQKNQQLVSVSNDILDKFSHVDWWDALNLNEPFVRDSHLKLEQMAQDYGDQIYDGKFDPRAVKIPAASPVQKQPATSAAENKPAANATTTPNPQPAATAAH